MGLIEGGRGQGVLEQRASFNRLSAVGLIEVLGVPFSRSRSSRFNRLSAVGLIEVRPPGCAPPPGGSFNRLSAVGLIEDGSGPPRDLHLLFQSPLGGGADRSDVVTVTSQSGKVSIASRRWG